MSDLKDVVIAAHGGLDRWKQLSEVRAHLLLGGVLWSVKKQDGVIKDSMVRVELHRQFASHYAFEKNGLRTSVTPDRAAIETAGGQVVAERSEPRAAFDGHVLDTPWDLLHLAYFHGYTMRNYLTTPFSFAEPDHLSGALARGRPDLAPAQGDVPLAHRYALRGTGLLLRRGRPAPPPRLHPGCHRLGSGRALHLGAPRVRRDHGSDTAAGLSGRSGREREGRTVGGGDRP